MSERWVDRLFSRLQVRYGSRWSMLWEGIDPEAVKADWIEVLGGIFAANPKAIAFGLDNLPEHPPTSDIFRAICNRVPSMATPALTAPNADPQRVQAALAKMKPPSDALIGPAYCAARLREISKERRLTPYQRDALKVYEAMQ